MIATPSPPYSKTLPIISEQSSESFSVFQPLLDQAISSIDNGRKRFNSQTNLKTKTMKTENPKKKIPSSITSLRLKISNLLKILNQTKTQNNQNSLLSNNNNNLQINFSVIPKSIIAWKSVISTTTHNFSCKKITSKSSMMRNPSNFQATKT